MEKEIWRPIKGYEGLYEVSNLGRIRSLDRMIIQPDGVKRLWKGRIRKPIKDTRENKGYLRVELSKDGILKKFAIHRLVAQTFIPNTNNLPQINHKDEDKINNFVFVNKDGSVDLNKSNLEWCDGKYNVNYGTRNKRIAKTQSTPVLQIGLESNEIIAEYPSTMEAARQLNIGSGAISMCCNGKLKTYKGFKWRYQD